MESRLSVPGDGGRSPNETVPNYVTKIDSAHSRRVIVALAVACPPVFVALLITGFGLRSVFWSIAALVIVMPPAVIYISRIAHTGICPTCGRRIRFSQMQDRYTNGDEYTYKCEDCSTIWKTGMWPGSNV
ncbi:hypothetical protein Pla52n_44090 [Stieleria varia]|uniref:Uncharacterized protein n=1 Tax=Stieleria varia TaxID=2528005 RepID=A0A5C6ANF4_9BACT|nr:hypothetical protein Pla52n_44090 [Stieleria varia]